MGQLSTVNKSDQEKDEFRLIFPYSLSHKITIFVNPVTRTKVCPKYGDT